MSLSISFKYFSLSLVLFAMSCGGSGGSGATKVIVVDFSAVDTDDRLKEDLQLNLALQQNGESFFTKNKGTWNAFDQELLEAGARSTFSFLTTNELKVEIVGNIPDFGPAHVISTAPYVIQKTAVAGNGLGTTQSLLKTVTCSEFIGVVEGRYLCGAAEIQTLELIKEAPQSLQFINVSDGEFLELRR